MCLTSIAQARKRTDPSEPSYFECFKVNSSTYRIVEHDSFGETPFIYVKINLTSVVVIDTGCGPRPATDPKAQNTWLRKFIETHPVPENGNAPLNPDGQKPYAVISTHCHFDHIGGIADFGDIDTTRIWASAYDRDFLSPKHLSLSSLCSDMGVGTPVYSVSNWADDGQTVTDNGGASFPLTIYQIPGHTPDQLAVWDSQERHLFVGDMAYLDAAILFLRGGSAVDYWQSLTKLIRLVGEWDSMSDPPVKISCGHKTSGQLAWMMLAEIDAVLDQILDGKVAASDQGDKYGMRDLQLYAPKNSRVSFLGPRETFDELLATYQFSGYVFK